MLRFKYIISYLLYYLSGLCLPRAAKPLEKTMLLIRLDLIGDYMLFRNYMRTVRQSSRYGKFKISLLGNSCWKELSEHVDKQEVDRFIWLDVERFKKQFFYRRKKIKELRSEGYEVVISPIYSRDYFSADWIVGQISATEKVGYKGDLVNIPAWQKRISDNYYTRLIEAEIGVMFEFERNKSFFESFLKESVEIGRPYIEISVLWNRFSLPDPYVVLFVGASKAYKRWPAEKFAAVGGHLRKTFGWHVVLCGGPGDLSFAKDFKHHFSGDYFNLVGGTSLVDLVHILAGAAFIVSNDTMAPHLAVAVDTPCVVIYNGIHLGRFLPYPNDMMVRHEVVFHPRIEENLSQHLVQSNAPDYVGKHPIAEIHENQVVDRIEWMVRCKGSKINPG